MSWLFYLLLLGSLTQAEEWLSVTHLQTSYILPQNEVLPSCQIFKHRRLQREKALREMKHNLKNQTVNTDYFLKDQYITNKLFLESHLWRDEVVTMVNTWGVPPGLGDELKNKGSQTFLKLTGDGIQWQEKMVYFPEEVTFFWDENNQILETHHQTYYVDYCHPQKASQLYWLRTQNASPLSTQIQLNQFLKDIKEI